MANICSFIFCAKGKKEDVSKVLDAIQQKTPELWIGRGATLNYTDLDFEEDSETGMVMVNSSGDCKWSIKAALVLDALDMEEQRTTGKGCWGDIDGVKKFMTIGEACKTYNVNMEFYSEEPGCCFAEHVTIENGEETWDCVDFHETYDEEADEWVTEGGYEDQSYQIEFPAA